MPLDPATAALLEMMAASGLPAMHEGTPEQARQSFRAMSCDLVTPDQVVPVGATEETTAGGVPSRIYRPEGEGPWPTLVYLHGGGFVIGDLDTHDQTCRRICSGAETVVLSVDYRLAPEAPFPAAVEDTLAAVAWAAEHLAELGGNDVLAVGGDSAGGNLAAVAAQAHPDTISAQVLIYPATHGTGEYPSHAENAAGFFLEAQTIDWFGAHYVGSGEVDQEDPRLSPYLGEVEGVGRALIVTAEFDPLRDEGEAYAAKLASAGVEVDQVRYDGLIHGFVDMGAMSPAAAEAVEDLVSRTRSLLHR